MAEVLGKSNLFTPCHNHHLRHQYHRRVSVLPISRKYKPASSDLRFASLKMKSPSLRSSPLPLDNDFYGRRVVVDERKRIPKKGNPQTFNAQMGLATGRAQKWWEKGLQSNMREVTSAQDLVDSLSNAGDKLVVVDFFSPGCGGCKALHPKICQFAEMNPDVQFLQVNYEEHKSMCYSLNVHVLPFFRFYRGALGRVCSFSCTNATIKKFKDALAKHIPDRCSLGPPKGLEEKELVALSANRDLDFNYTPKPQPVPVLEEVLAAAADSISKPSLPVPLTRAPQDAEEKSLVAAGR